MSSQSNQLTLGLLAGAALVGGAGYYLYSQYQKKKQQVFTDRTIELVQRSWKKVEEIGIEAVGSVLFRNIFEAAPEAIQMFSFKDIPDFYNSRQYKMHGRIVVYTVGVAVAGLKNVENLVHSLKVLGKTHKNLNVGIVAAHYDLVGQMLIKTLKDNLKPEDFPPEVEKAWLDVYAVVSATMQAGAEE